MNKKILSIFPFLIVLMIFAFFISCSGKKEEEPEEEVPAETPAATVTLTTATPEPTESPTPSPRPTEDITGKAIDSLTGLYIPEELADKRPAAVVINNMHRALPQSGIGEASIVYEMLAEGNITRLIGIFRDYGAEKIGPVRSARHYFIDFAMDYDAVFVHHGGSPQGYESIRSQKVNNLDGMRLGNTFWRDPARASVPSMLEHSSYTNAERIREAIDALGYREDLTGDETVGFRFFALDTGLPGAENAEAITVPFSNDYMAIFEYDPETKLYDKFNERGPHIDENTDEQLTYKNVLIQITTINVIAGDSEGRRDIKTVGSGEGFLATNGGYVPVTWSKDGRTSPARWYFEDGSEMLLNKGKTWINVVSAQTGFVIGEKEEKDE